MHSRNFKIHKKRPVGLPPKRQPASQRLSPNNCKLGRGADVGLAARIALRDWRDVVLPRHRERVRTAAHRAARLELTDTLDAIGNTVARDIVVSRAAEVVKAMEWYGER